MNKEEENKDENDKEYDFNINNINNINDNNKK